MGWQLDGTRSIYLQLVDRIVRRIVTGVYPPGSRMASVRELAEEAGVNPNTMQRALAHMEELGVLYTQRTAGRFVTEDSEKIYLLREEEGQRAAKDFAASMKELGYTTEELIALLQKTASGEEEA